LAFLIAGLGELRLFYYFSALSAFSAVNLSKEDLMKKPKGNKTSSYKTNAAFEKAVKKKKSDNTFYVLRLYVVGLSPRSRQAINNIKKLCDEYLKGRYELEVIDIYQQSEMAKEAQLIAAPTLIKKLPLPLRRFIGDMSNKERILVGLGVKV
jgi:circadian clock protein KaiB